MLRVPSKGFSESVKAHNVNIDALTEWIEGSVVFSDDTISQSDVVDILIEENIYRIQDFAQERVESAWLELARRHTILGRCCPYRLTKKTVVRTSNWRETPAYSFCLMLSLQCSFRATLQKHVKQNFGEQGPLFERLTSESLAKRGWSTNWKGWSKEKSNSIRDKVERLETHLGEVMIDDGPQRWTSGHAKDAGLDIVCHLPFADTWAGRPLYFIQCASGDDWKEKRSTPNISTWEKLIDLCTKPKRGLAMPFALMQDDFRKAANYDNLVLLLDRHRLASPTAAAKNWESATLQTDLNNWTDPRAAALPLANN